MPKPSDFLPAKPPFAPIPTGLAKQMLNDYKFQPTKEKGGTPEEQLMSAMLGENVTQYVRCNVCDVWLPEEETIYFDNMAYHYSCVGRRERK